MHRSKLRIKENLTGKKREGGVGEKEGVSIYFWLKTGSGMNRAGTGTREHDCLFDGKEVGGPG